MHFFNGLLGNEKQPHRSFPFSPSTGRRTPNPSMAHSSCEYWLEILWSDRLAGDLPDRLTHRVRTVELNEQS